MATDTTSNGIIKKSRVVKRVKTGLAGVPFEKGFRSVQFYFFENLDKKDYAPIIKSYIKEKYSKADQKVIFANKEYVFNNFNYAAGIYWIKAGLDFQPEDSTFPGGLERYISGLIENGHKQMMQKDDEAEEGVVVAAPKLSIADRIKNKVQETIMVDLDELEDSWIENEKTPAIDVYNLFKKYELKGIAVEHVKKRIQTWTDHYTEAVNKTCDQMVEGYSHLTKKELKRRIDECNKMLIDLGKLKSSATRKARVPKTPKAKAADKQVAKMKYKINDSEYKLESISPMLIVGATKLYTFNTKTRKVAVYITDNPNGFEVSGSSIKGFVQETSVTFKLRKPDEVLPVILSKAPKAIEKTLDGIKAVRSSANGRINTDTIILKAIR